MIDDPIDLDDSVLDDFDHADVEATVADSHDSAHSEASEVIIDSVEDKFIEVGDQVTYCLLDLPSEKQTVWITDGESNLKLGIINEKSPVAQALLGLAEGDIGELQITSSAVMKTRELKVLKIQSRQT